MSNVRNDVEIDDELRELGFSKRSGSDVYVDSCGPEPRFKQPESYREVFDYDGDETERLFECVSTGKFVTYDVRSLFVGHSRTGRYNLVWAYEARDMNLHYPSKHILADIAQEGVVICNGVIVIETLEKAISELLDGLSDDFLVWCIQLIDDKNLLIDLRKD